MTQVRMIARTILVKKLVVGRLVAKVPPQCFVVAVVEPGVDAEPCGAFDVGRTVVYEVGMGGIHTLEAHDRRPEGGVGLDSAQLEAGVGGVEVFPDTLLVYDVPVAEVGVRADGAAHAIAAERVGKLHHLSVHGGLEGAAEEVVRR